MTAGFQSQLVFDVGTASDVLSGSGPHDAICLLPGTPVWQDIAIPGHNLLHIPDGDLMGEVFDYDGLTVSVDGGTSLFTYTVGSILIRFSCRGTAGVYGSSVGSGPGGPSVSLDTARSIFDALSSDWTDSPEGFDAVTEEIGTDNTISYHRRPIVQGLSVCTDGSESWIESERSEFGVTGARLDLSDGDSQGILWIDTDRCTFGFPVGGDPI